VAGRALRAPRRPEEPQDRPIIRQAFAQGPAAAGDGSLSTPWAHSSPASAYARTTNIGAAGLAGTSREQVKRVPVAVALAVEISRLFTFR